jgi:hypothetical protein
METTILTTINPITEAFEKLFKNSSDRKAIDFLLENYDKETIKSELIYFSKKYLLSTIVHEIEAQKKYKRKIFTFDELVKYLVKNICSKDCLRPSMNSVYYDKVNSNLVSTDAYILAKLPIKYLPISDKLDNFYSFDNENFSLIRYSQNSFKIDKYGDIINKDIDDKYPDYEAILPEENYLDYPYFTINPYLFNGLKNINKIAKKFKFDNFYLKLSCLENLTYLNLELLCRYIDLHQKIYGNYSYIYLTRNGNDLGRMLYNVDYTNEYRLILMPCSVDERFDKFLDLDL